MCLLPNLLEHCKLHRLQHPSTCGATSKHLSQQKHVHAFTQGVALTLESGPDGQSNVLKRVHFSPRLFDESSASQWWAANKGRVVRQLGLIPSGGSIQADLDSPMASRYCALQT